MTSRRAALLRYAAFVGASLAAGLVASRSVPGEWSAALEKPVWTPPDSLFAPVWTVLYVAIGTAGGRLGVRGSAPGATAALVAWWGQLLLNAAWSWIFFGLHRPGWALAEIGLLVAVVVFTAVRAWGVDRPAALLLVPYLGWLLFAAALNAALWTLNR